VVGSEFFMRVCVHAMALRSNFMFDHASYVVSMYVVQSSCSLYMYQYLRNDQFSLESIRLGRADCKSFPKRAFCRPA
jgi:hypothetical protein